ncbi:hypothetical protein K1T71_003642 [Dendrolimus kikuchii]|uniref:Uncharacterized protein n=1 Tax=Dendrolimus kikuchii TaxID=765133 RepID=A0ACC1D9H8_9NEOP|nr:hypothetical protein K1T71_003642 [Dendrolimus kikuchii]
MVRNTASWSLLSSTTALGCEFDKMYNLWSKSRSALLVVLSQKQPTSVLINVE